MVVPKVALWMLSLSPVASATPGSEVSWDVLEAEGPRVECTQDAGEPWCRSTALVRAPLDDVAATLEDMPRHQADFDSVRSIPVLGGEGRLEPDAGGTRVTFTWQAEVAGSFLSWAVGIARRRVGRLALADLARARDAELKPLP